MSSAGSGYGEGFFYTPEDQAAQQAIRRRQSYAQALMQGKQHEGRYGGLADAGNSILGAFLANRADKDATNLATKTQTKYSADLANLLKGGSGPSPQISNAPQEMDPEGNPMASKGPQVDPEGNPVASQAPAQPQSIMERIAASGNPALMYQFGPQALQAQMQNEMTRGNKLWENDLPESRAARDARAGNLQSQETLAEHNNQLPSTPQQLAENTIQQQTANAATTSANKPQFVPYGAPGYMQAGKYTAFPGGGAGNTPFGTGDEKSTSLQGQLGISTAGLNYLLGNTSQLGMRDKQMASKEVDGLVARTGLDQSTLKAKAQAYSSAVTMNTLKSNTMDTLTNELKGSIANISPVADNLGGGRLRWVNGAAQFIGGLENDPNAQQYALYLSNLRAELAGLNAVSGGKIGMHGQVQTDNADFAAAEKVIKDGLDRGGAAGLAKGVEAMRQKNVAIVEHQSDEAQRGIWNALGIGKNYDAVHPHAAPNPASAPPPAAGAPKVIKYDAQGNRVP